MRSIQRPIRTVVSAAVVATIVNSSAFAGSFSLYTESSAGALGNYAAGIAAEAANASTGWYNPAGLSLLRVPQGVAGLAIVAPKAKLYGTSTFASTGIPPYIEPLSGVNGAKMGYVPSGHVALPVGENTTVGFSVTAPFGLATKWDRYSPVRYQATTSFLLTTDFSPEIGSRITEHLAVGAGIDLQYAHVRFHRMLGSPDSLVASHTSAFLLDSMSYNKGSSFGVGFHAGLMGLFNADHTRLGVNYQSRVQHRFNGYSVLGGRLANLSPIVTPATIFAASPTATFRSDQLASNTVTFPDITTLSAYHDLNNRIALLGSVVYTGWKSLQSLELQRVAAYAPLAGQIFVNSSTSEFYRNAWRFALGANYQYNELLMLRVGGGYDQTPTRTEFKDVRVPDSDRWALSVGAHYQVKPSIGIDLGYTHLFSAGNTRMNKRDLVGTSSTYHIIADIKGSADLVGIQAVWTLDQPMVMPTK